MRSIGLTPAAPSQASRVAVPVYCGEKQVGKATTTTWSPVLKKMIALASVDTDHSKIGARVQMEITIEASAAEGHGEDCADAVFQSEEEDGGAGVVSFHHGDTE